jgi:hypothetical protein
MMRQLAALGCPPFEPTEDQRELVRVLAFNGVPAERIAMILELREIEVVYHFRRELDLSEDYVLAKAAKTVMELADQRNDLGVALRAAEAMLRARSPRWREPKAVEAEEAAKPVEMMSLPEVDRAIAELQRRRRGDAAPVDAEAAASDVEGVAG